jgi:4-diphosphocytidyl-2-C-methyl-D-erythritol kinase
MVRFPNAKINLGLKVINKRSDNYHNIETIFYPIALRDALEIIPSKEMQFEVSGLEVTGNPEDNLCLKAYRLLKKDFPQLPNLKIHLHKTIPAGAGLGGGSSDGAFMLKMLNEKFRLQLTEEALTNYALQLGSDCPFFIINQPCFATGRGEILTPVILDLSGYTIIVVNPEIHVSTKEAFSKLTPKQREKSMSGIVLQPVSIWKEELENDFEKFIFDLYPAIKEIKDEMYAAGAEYASMTGTGSTVFGIFPKGFEVNFSFSQKYLCFTT